MYAKGHGVEQNYVVAMDWYNKAADLGSPWAYERIGTMYATGSERSEERPPERTGMVAEGR